MLLVTIRKAPTFSEVFKMSERLLFAIATLAAITGTAIMIMVTGTTTAIAVNDVSKTAWLKSANTG